MPNMTLNSFGAYVKTGAKISIKPAIRYNSIIAKPKYIIILEKVIRTGLLFNNDFAERKAQEPFSPVYCFSSYFKEATSLTSQKTS